MSAVKLLCTPCGYSTGNLVELERHKKGEKHLKNLNSKKQKVLKELRINAAFRCDVCGFETKIKSEFDVHFKAHQVKANNKNNNNNNNNNNKNNASNSNSVVIKKEPIFMSKIQDKKKMSNLNSKFQDKKNPAKFQQNFDENSKDPKKIQPKKFSNLKKNSDFNGNLKGNPLMKNLPQISKNPKSILKEIRNPTISYNKLSSGGKNFNENLPKSAKFQQHKTAKIMKFPPKKGQNPENFNKLMKFPSNNSQNFDKTTKFVAKNGRNNQNYPNSEKTMKFAPKNGQNLHKSQTNSRENGKNSNSLPRKKMMMISRADFDTSSDESESSALENAMKCAKCDFTTESERLLRCHEKEAHIMKKRPHSPPKVANNEVSPVKKRKLTSYKFKCGQCEFSAVSQHFLQDHEKRIHDSASVSSSSSPKRFVLRECPKCDFTSLSKVSLEIHVQDEHGIVDEQQKVEEESLIKSAPKVRPSESVLDQVDDEEQEVEKGPKVMRNPLFTRQTRQRNKKLQQEFKCDECDHVAASIGKLQAHKIIHQDEDSLNCSNCDFAAKTQGQLNRHEKTCGVTKQEPKKVKREPRTSSMTASPKPEITPNPPPTAKSTPKSSMIKRRLSDSPGKSKEKSANTMIIKRAAKVPSLDEDESFHDREQQQQLQEQQQQQQPASPFALKIFESKNAQKRIRISDWEWIEARMTEMAAKALELGKAAPEDVLCGSSLAYNKNEECGQLNCTTARSQTWWKEAVKMLLSRNGQHRYRAWAQGEKPKDGEDPASKWVPVTAFLPKNINETTFPIERVIGLLKLMNPGMKGGSNIEHIYSSLRGRYVVFEASLEFLQSLQERSMRLNFPTGQIMFTLGKHGERNQRLALMPPPSCIKGNTTDDPIVIDD